MPLTEQGFKRLTFSEILANQIDRAKLLFGDDIDTSEQTPLGKYIRINTYDLAEMYEALEGVYYARFPNTASGVSLDRLCVFAGISRNAATYSEHTIKIIGTAGTTVDMGFLVQSGDVVFHTMDYYTIGEDGTVETLVQCNEAGTIGNVALGSIDTIVNPIANVTSIEHIEIVSLGDEEESDYELRQRFSETVAGIGSGPADAIRGAILRVPQVDGVSILTNETNETVGVLPPHSFICYVNAPATQDTLIAQAIFDKKPVGIQSIGDVSVTLKDDGGMNHTISFSRTIEKYIYIKATIKVNAYFPSDGVVQIKQNLVEYISGLSNNEEVYISSLYGLIHIDGVTTTTNLQLSVDGETYASVDIECNEQEIARTSESMIEITVVSVS